MSFSWPEILPGFAVQVELPDPFSCGFDKDLKVGFDVVLSNKFFEVSRPEAVFKLEIFFCADRV